VRRPEVRHSRHTCEGRDEPSRGNRFDSSPVAARSVETVEAGVPARLPLALVFIDGQGRPSPPINFKIMH